MDPLSGAFILTIYLFGGEVPGWQRQRKAEFSTYADCLLAAEVISGHIDGDNMVTCSSKSTGEVRATWQRGPKTQ